MRAADIAIFTMAALAFPVWIYAARQQWSQKPGATGRMLKSGCLFVAIIMIGMLTAYLLG